jgi:hypothetical protein
MLLDAPVLRYGMEKEKTLGFALSTERETVDY